MLPPGGVLPPHQPDPHPHPRSRSHSRTTSRRASSPAAVIFRSEVGPALRFVGLLPEAPTTQAARREEARLVFRLCRCLIAAAAGNRTQTRGGGAGEFGSNLGLIECTPNDTQNAAEFGSAGGRAAAVAAGGWLDSESEMAVPLGLFCRFVGAATVSFPLPWLPQPPPPLASPLFTSPRV